MTLTTERTRVCSTLLLASLLAFPTLSFSASPPASRARASAAYDRAVRLRAALAGQPESARQKADYEKVIRAFRSVYQISPVSGKAPLALAAVAELYREMGRQLASDRYYTDAVQAHDFLMAQYPQHRASREALFTVGEIYLSDLDNLEEARRAFEKYIGQNPRSPKAPEARKRLQQIDRVMADQAAGRATARRSVAGNRRAEGIPQVTAIRRWVGPNYSRIVISVDDEVKFDASRVANPDRIVFDLQNARLSPGLIGKTFPVEDGFLRQIRIAQFKPAVTRVVLDVEKIEDYSVFPLPNPFRLVIDIHGAPTPAPEKTAIAKEAAPTPPATEISRAAAKPETSSNSVAPSTSSPRGSAKGATVAARTELKPPTEKSAPGSKASAEAELKKPQPQGEAKTKKTSALKAPEASHPATEAGANAVPRESTPPAIQPAVPTESGARTLTRALGLKISRIVIDPGHGGHDTGTIGPTGLKEKDLVLDVALVLKNLIERNMGGEVIMTRDDDTFIPLEERTAIANEKSADLFVSIHANASRDRSARGIETYYLNFTSSPETLEVAARENATSQESVHQLQDLIKKIALTEKIEESHEFATQVQREFRTRLARTGGEQRDRGVKKAPFVVLIGANMPSILAEISFLTNPRDERLLKRGDYRQKIADGLYRGIARYVKNLGGVASAQQARLSDTARETSQESTPADPSNF